MSGDRSACDVEVTDIHQRAFTDRGRAENHVLQLPYIARPAIAQQRRISAGCQAAHRALDLRASLLHKGACQQQNILATLAQRRHFKVQHVQAVKKVFTKRPFIDHLFEVTVGRAEDPHVDLDLTLAAHPTKAAVIQKAQQLGLQVGRHFGDFIEKHRAVVGQLHQPRLAAALGAGEGAGGIAKQLAFSQVFRERRAVQGQKRRCKAGADCMAGAGHEFFASAGFALNQQGRIQRRHALGTGLQGADRRGVPE